MTASRALEGTTARAFSAMTCDCSIILRYDREFLLQFMQVCKEKPPQLPPLDVLGLEPVDQTSFAMTRWGLVDIFSWLRPAHLRLVSGLDQLGMVAVSSLVLLPTFSRWANSLHRAESLQVKNAAHYHQVPSQSLITVILLFPHPLIAFQ